MAPHNSIRPEQLHNSIRPKQYESNNLACGNSLSVCSMVLLREFSLSSCVYPFPTLGIVVGSRPCTGDHLPTELVEGTEARGLTLGALPSNEVQRYGLL